MAYQPPEERQEAQAEAPVHERAPRMVTPLTRLAATPADVDCPHCKKVVMTDVRKTPAEGTECVATRGSFMSCMLTRTTA